MPDLNDILTPDLQRNPLIKALSAMWDQSGVTSPEFESLLGTLHQQVSGAAAQRASAAEAFSEAVNKPQPQTNPIADMLARSLGSAAQGFTGSEAGPKLSEQTIGNEQQRLLTARAENLAALADANQRAADRANKLGDLETEIKLRQAADKARDRHQAVSQMLQTVAEQTMIGQREALSAGRQAKLQIGLQQSELNWRGMQNDLQNAQSERNANIAAGLKPDGSGPNPANWHQRNRAGTGASFVTPAQFNDDMQAKFNAAQKSDHGGRPTFNIAELRNTMLTLTPSSAYQNDPDGLYLFFAQQMDPRDKSGKSYLYPHKTTKTGDDYLDPVWHNRIVDYIRQHGWPNYVPNSNQ